MKQPQSLNERFLSLSSLKNHARHFSGHLSFPYNNGMDKKANSTSKIIGWREWVALPDLGLIAIKGKVDTGAKTSSLHAFDIKLVEFRGKTYVHFKVHPAQKSSCIVQTCKALLVDKRQVTDSGGHKQERFVILTTMLMAGIKKKVELTLTNRETMKYRMLIGREALNHLYIDPTQSYLGGQTLKQKKYLKVAKKKIQQSLKKS